MAVYPWATNPGTRVAPTTTQQETGAVSGQPLGSGVFNAVIGEISDETIGLRDIVTEALAQLADLDLPQATIVRVSTAERATKSGDVWAWVGLCRRPSLALMGGLPSLALEFGYRSDTHVIQCIEVDSGSTPGLGTTVHTGSALGTAKFKPVVKPNSNTVVLLYHMGDSISCRKSTDAGATWGSAVEAWDPTDEAADDEFFEAATDHGWMEAIYLERGSKAGRLILVAPYWDDSESEAYLRYVYSDDDGATWENNGGAGFALRDVDDSTNHRSLKLFQDRDGYIWTIFDTKYLRSAGSETPAPADPTPGDLVYEIGRTSGLVVDPSGASVTFVGYGGGWGGGVVGTYLVAIHDDTLVYLGSAMVADDGYTFSDTTEKTPIGGLAVLNDGSVLINRLTTDPSPDEGHVLGLTTSRRVLPPFPPS